ncbi:MAG: hypothetical protein LHV69_01670 [Elusimicrobia bacterium]|nr:hypothetical protein [Candidatus Obscuribacterium magneticum]
MAPEQTAQTYSSAVTAASKSALLELMTMFRSYREAIVLVGGWVPAFLLEQCHRVGDTFTHIGSIDIDLAINPGKISSAQYATIVELLTQGSYQPASDREGKPIPFSFEKMISSPIDAKLYKIRVDFLTHERDLRPGKHRHSPVQEDLLARKARGCEAAFQHKTEFELRGVLHGGGQISMPIRMADVVGCITMKGIVLGERFKEKDAYDTYALAAHYGDGPKSVADRLKPYTNEPLLKEALNNIQQAFSSRDAHGPIWVADFLGPASAAERDRMVTHAFMVVNEMIRLLFPQ